MSLKERAPRPSSCSSMGEGEINQSPRQTEGSCQEGAERPT